MCQNGGTQIYDFTTICLIVTESFSQLRAITKGAHTVRLDANRDVIDGRFLKFVYRIALHCVVPHFCHGEKFHLLEIKGSFEGT